VAVVTNIGSGDHLGLNYISTVEDLAVVKRVIVHSVARGGTAVLNAADPVVAAMANACPGRVTFFAMHRHEPVLANHLAQGKRGVFVDDGAIVAAKGKLRYRVPLADIPVTAGGNIPFQIENALAATATAWGLGIPWNIIRRGLATFVSDSQTVPGRFNLFPHRGATLIADYGHNPDAIRALVQAIECMPAKRRIVVISGAGDRRDCDLRAQTEILGDSFDEVILYQDQCQRGRADGEVLAVLRAGLAQARRAAAVEEIRGEFQAIDAALSRLGDGDLCVVLIDQIDAALAHIAMRVAQG
jgi:cyanophycin synthetase